MRQASIARKTKETDITCRINLDGAGASRITTGIGFLDHMLEQIARHGLIDIDLKATGDLHIDYHHTTEDTGIVLGQAIRQALGDMKGITRFGHAYVPLDESLSRVVVDISGRPQLVWKVNFIRDKVGEMDTELFREFFGALAQHSGITLHVENLYGENNHHIVESSFKAFARALKQAVALDARSTDVPSTKGAL